MNRRMLMTGFVAMTLAPLAARAKETIAYSPGVIDAALKDGKTVFVDFAADWCSTCKRQERVINALRQQNPAYDQAMTFVTVDWDEFRRHPVTTSRAIPRRSTLLVLRGDQELGRLVAGTGEADIKALMDKGL